MTQIKTENIRNQVFDSSQFLRVREYLINKYNIKNEDLATIVKYMEDRKAEIKGKESFGIVYVITRTCNLNCLHCGVNAKIAMLSKGSIEDELSFQQAKIVIDKIASYIKERSFRPFLMFGGGEPSLLKDFPKIIKYASKVLGPENVGFCTNGTTLLLEDLLSIEPYVGLIETSIDGMETEHNLMRDPKGLTSIKNPFKITLSLVQEALKHQSLKSKIEVSAVLTKKNRHSLPELARFLRSIGLEKFSTHRAIPVGRMATNAKYILSKEEYLDFFIKMAQIREEDPKFKWHMHHSLETIYSTLLYGEDIHHDPSLPMGSGRHSIGIDWEGDVFFDAWSVVSPFKILKSQNLIYSNITLFDVLDSPNSMVGLVNNATRRNLRCKQCRVLCSGGMRFNAIFNYAINVGGRIQDSHFLAGLSEIDPACLISD